MKGDDMKINKNEYEREYEHSKMCDTDLRIPKVEVQSCNRSNNNDENNDNTDRSYIFHCT